MLNQLIELKILANQNNPISSTRVYTMYKWAWMFLGERRRVLQISVGIQMPDVSQTLTQCASLLKITKDIKEFAVQTPS